MTGRDATELCPKDGKFSSANPHEPSVPERLPGVPLIGVPRGVEDGVEKDFGVEFLCRAQHVRAPQCELTLDGWTAAFPNVTQSKQCMNTDNRALQSAGEACVPEGMSVLQASEHYLLATCE